MYAAAYATASAATNGGADATLRMGSTAGAPAATAVAESNADKKAPGWTADPAIGHLINVMRRVGPKLPQGDFDPDLVRGDNSSTIK
jgi:hypothetical protein